MAFFYKKLVRHLRTCLASTGIQAPLLIGLYVYNYVDWPKRVRTFEQRLYGK